MTGLYCEVKRMDEKELEQLREAAKALHEAVQLICEFIREVAKVVIKCLPELQRMEERHRKEQVRLVMKHFDVPKLSSQVGGQIPRIRPVIRSNC